MSSIEGHLNSYGGQWSGAFEAVRQTGAFEAVRQTGAFWEGWMMSARADREFGGVLAWETRVG
jgi:hypothetical protein